MPYKDKNRHNSRRQEKRRMDVIKEVTVCYRCGSNQAYLLTLEDVKQLPPREIKKLDALCLNCLTKGKYCEGVL